MLTMLSDEEASKKLWDYIEYLGLAYGLLLVILVTAIEVSVVRFMVALLLAPLSLIIFVALRHQKLLTPQQESNVDMFVYAATATAVTNYYLDMFGFSLMALNVTGAFLDAFLKLISDPKSTFRFDERERNNTEA